MPLPRVRPASLPKYVCGVERYVWITLVRAFLYAAELAFSLGVFGTITDADELYDSPRCAFGSEASSTEPAGYTSGNAAVCRYGMAAGIVGFVAIVFIAPVVFVFGPRSRLHLWRAETLANACLSAWWLPAAITLAATYPSSAYRDATDSTTKANTVVVLAWLSFAMPLLSIALAVVFRDVLIDRTTWEDDEPVPTDVAYKRSLEAGRTS